jgi:hypothetical protein
LRCPHCELVVARPSHLARHVQSHLHPSQRERYACDQCPRQFSRNDVLLRHLRTAHQAVIAPKRSAQKSCFRCVKKKLKCDRIQTCMPCAKGGHSCTYPIEEEQAFVDDPASIDGGSTESLTVQVQPQIEVVQLCSRASYHDPGIHMQLPPEENSVISAPAIENQPFSPNGQSGFAGSTPPFPTPSRSRPVAQTSPGLMSFSPGSPNTTSSGFDRHMMQFDGCFLTPFTSAPTDPAPRIAGMIEGGLDWLSLELESPNSQDMQSQWPSVGVSTSFQPPPMSTGLEQVLQNAAQPVESAQLVPIRAHDVNAAILKANDHLLAARQWPFEQTRTPDSQQCRLPPLRDILQGTVPPNEPEEGAVIRSLIHLMSGSYLPETNSAHDASMISATQLLKTALEHYFSEFHAVLPLIHIPTFHINKTPTVTLAAMACIGAMYLDAKQGTERSWSLSEICIQMIAWLVS